MAKAKKQASTTKVEATTHPSDTRLNIPTAELESFAADAEAKPGSLLYPRDLALDPQLIWKGKDDQDRSDLEVPVVPVYIQETIEPRALIEDLRAASKERRDEDVLTLFADPFEDLSLAERVDFYRHQGKWTNRLILGDSLLTMASLAQKEGLKGEVQMIYMDPPYGIKFGSNWQVSTRKREVGDGKVADLTAQPEQVRAFRDTWALGVHSYLAYMRDRLVLCRDLLADTGSIILQIGDENVHLVRCLLDDVFGAANFISLITYVKTTGTTGAFLPGTCDYLLWYGKDSSRTKYRELYESKVVGGVGGTLYSHVVLPDGSARLLLPSERENPALVPVDARVFGVGDLTSARVREARTGYYPVEFEGSTYYPPKREWSTNQVGMLRLIWAGRVARSGSGLGYKRYLTDYPVFPLGNVWTDTVGQNQYGGPKTFVVQTALKAI